MRNSFYVPVFVIFRDLGRNLGLDMESIISSLLVGGLSLIGVIFTSTQTNKQIENKLSTAQAVTDTRLQGLATEVKRHNDFWLRVPVLESRIKALEHDLEELQRICRGNNYCSNNNSNNNPE